MTLWRIRRLSAWRGGQGLVLQALGILAVGVGCVGNGGDAASREMQPGECLHVVVQSAQAENPTHHLRFFKEAAGYRVRSSGVIPGQPDQEWSKDYSLVDADFRALINEVHQVEAIGAVMPAAWEYALSVQRPGDRQALVVTTTMGDPYDITIQTRHYPVLNRILGETIGYPCYHWASLTVSPPNERVCVQILTPEERKKWEEAFRDQAEPVEAGNSP